MISTLPTTSCELAYAPATRFDREPCREQTTAGPSAEEIFRRVAKIQQEWDPAERRRRETLGAERMKFLANMLGVSQVN